jgi:hypothetical protein
MDRLSKLIRQLFPGRGFMLVLFQNSKNDKVVVDMLTNCALDELAGVLGQTALEIRETSSLAKNRLLRGNACWLPLLAEGFVEVAMTLF